MKVKKCARQKKTEKNRCKRVLLQLAMVCALVCSVVQLMPERIFAVDSGNYSYKCNTSYVDGTGQTLDVQYDISGSMPIYLFEFRRKDISFYSFASLASFSGKYSISSEKNSSSFSVKCSGDRCGKYGSIYSTLVSLYGNPKRIVFDYDKICKDYDNGSSSVCGGENLILHYEAEYLYAKNKFNMDYFIAEEGDGVEGSVNNPIEDDQEIGTPIITKRRYTTVYHDTDMGNASDGKEDIDDSQFIFDWSNKTSTGFNLKKNKYHMTRIQIKVQSKCVVYSGFSHKTVKKRFDNYGEMSSEIKSALVDDTPYSIEYGTVKSMLPKTFSEKHNPLYIGRNFTFYFRVMCNESASGTGRWHCGPWRAVGLNASTTQDQTDESSNGHIDSDGNYTKDPDDGHNNSDSDSSTVDDKEDAKDQFKDDQKNDVTNGKNDSSGFEWSDLKKLVNECKEVPALIKSIFSFLPDWVLVFVAVGFGIWIFVLIKRAIV